MRRLFYCAVIGIVLVTVPSAVAASPTVRLALIHAMRGCHVWGTVDSQPLGASHTVALKRGGRIEIRISCPMGFDVTQLAGPRLDLGGSRWETGTTHTLVFAKAGIYRVKAVNVESSADQGLQTLGPDNAPLLTVRVR